MNSMHIRMLRSPHFIQYAYMYMYGNVCAMAWSCYTLYLILISYWHSIRTYTCMYLPPNTTCIVHTSSPGPFLYMYMLMDGFHSLSVHPSPVGKYPHLMARVVSKAAKKAATTAPGASTRWQSEVTVNFHEVAVGTTVEKFIEIANVSPVSTDISSLINR